MQKHGDSLLLSASDLVGHLNCGHLTSLDFAVASGALEKPAKWDPLLELLFARGAQHEQGFVEHLKEQGLAVTTIEGVGVDSDAVAQTLKAMRAGAEMIVQGAFQVSEWVGRASKSAVVRRVRCSSRTRFVGILNGQLRYRGSRRGFPSGQNAIA